MKNFVAEGKTLTLLAPYQVVSGDGLLVGSVFGVASNDAANGAEVEAVVEGIFTLKKTNAQAWTVGALIYWDNAAKECTTTVSTNKLVGTAMAIASNPTPTGLVRLNGSFIS